MQVTLSSVVVPEVDGVDVGVDVAVVVVVVVVSVELHASSITQCSWYLFTCTWRSSTL